MNYEQAIERLKRGRKVKRGGRIFELRSRGVYDVTDVDNPARVYMLDEERAATDWEEVR